MNTQKKTLINLLEKYKAEDELTTNQAIAEIQALVESAIPEKLIRPILDNGQPSEYHEGYNEAIDDIITALIERGLLAKGERNESKRG